MVFKQKKCVFYLAENDPTLWPFPENTIFDNILSCEQGDQIGRMFRPWGDC
jgi:hypothetical protein